MRKVGSREFKNRLGRYLAAVKKGHSLLITAHGRPVAKLIPPNQNEDIELSFSDVLRKLEAEGKIRLAKRPLGEFRAIPSRGKLASQMILEDRR